MKASLYDPDCIYVNLHRRITVLPVDKLLNARERDRCLKFGSSTNGIAFDTKHGEFKNDKVGFYRDIPENLIQLDSFFQCPNRYLIVDFDFLSENKLILLCNTPNTIFIINLLTMTAVQQTRIRDEITFTSYLPAPHFDMTSYPYLVGFYQG